MPRRLAVLLVAASLTLAGCSGAARASKDSVDVVGLTTYAVNARHAAPTLTGKAFDGSALTLSALGAGKVVLLNVWASWCGPCREESPMLGASAKTYEPQGVVFVGIDEQDTASAGRAFATSAGMTYSNFVDPDGALLSKLKMLPQMGIPSTLVLDKHGRIAARVIGPTNAPELKQVLDNLIAETGPRASSNSTAVSATTAPTSSTTAGTAAATWNSPELVITGHSLGAVTIGMTLSQAARAAGVPEFTQIGDGVSVPAPGNVRVNDLDLYISFASFVGQARFDFTCVGAVMAANPIDGTQVVVTPEGVRLGDPASRVQQVYGVRAEFVPEPTTGGIEPAAGYVVAEQGYDLVFKLNPQGAQIVAIFGGVAPTTPSNCPS
jgi:thiol-disulfide isomerase/thioredoxin